MKQSVLSPPPRNTSRRGPGFHPARTNARRAPVQALDVVLLAELYREPGGNGECRALYLTFVLAVCWLPTLCAGSSPFAASHTEAPKIARQFPEINRSNGVMAQRPPGRHEFAFRLSGTPYDPPMIMTIPSTTPSRISENGGVLTRAARRTARAGDRACWS